MEIIVPVEVGLKSEIVGSVAYINPAWTSGATYASGSVVRYERDGVMSDWRANSTQVANSSNAPGSSYYIPWDGIGLSVSWTRVYYWTRIGPAAMTTTSVAWSTNTVRSVYPEWALGAVAEGATVFDPANNRDYRALIAMTSPENTLRPSAAVLSALEIERSKWLDLGASNAWAPLDYFSNSLLYGFGTNGSQISSVVFTVNIATPTTIDRIAFAGMTNCQGLQIKTYVGGVLSQTLTKSLIPIGESYGARTKTAVFKINPVAAGATLTAEITLTQSTASAPVQLRILCAGRGLELSNTEWGVETSILPFSKKERNETFGTVSFLKRGSARQVRASCFIDTSKVSGDVVQQILADVDGMPVYWDFNNPGSDYDRLRVFGFYSSMRTAISAFTFESLSLDVEGLVE